MVGREPGKRRCRPQHAVDEHIGRSSRALAGLSLPCLLLLFLSRRPVLLWSMQHLLLVRLLRLCLVQLCLQLLLKAS